MHHQCIWIPPESSQNSCICICIKSFSVVVSEKFLKPDNCLYLCQYLLNNHHLCILMSMLAEQSSFVYTYVNTCKDLHKYTHTNSITFVFNKYIYPIMIYIQKDTLDRVWIVFAFIPGSTDMLLRYCILCMYVCIYIYTHTHT
jgi:hypothetical protein